MHDAADAWLAEERALAPRVWEERPFPAASLAHGQAGLAFALVEHFRLSGEARSLDRARQHVLAAQRLAERSSVDAFTCARGPASPYPLSVLEGGVFTGFAGIGYVLALVGSAQRDDEVVGEGVAMIDRGFALARESAPRVTELFAGLAGYVALAEDLARRGIVLPAVTEVGERAASLLIDNLGAQSPGECLGAAHGRAGELLALVRHTTRDTERLSGWIEDQRARARRSGPYVLWPTRVGGPVPGNLWWSFCNGVTGQALLFTEACRVGPTRERLRDLAAGAVRSLEGIEMPAVANICCGAAGQAVALDHFARVAGEPRERAWARLDLARGNAETLDRWSLLQGRLGIDWLRLLADHRHPLFVPLLFEPPN
ncbi:MAG TPA: lanthionine synthetase LanC family protein [Polyangiaceae bacterium]